MTLVVAGVDLAAGRGATELAVLAIDDAAARPRFDARDHVTVSTDEEIIGVIAGVSPAVVAIDAPLTLPRSVAAALGVGNRDNEGALVSPSTSPYTRAAERSPLWKELGVRPLPVSFLGGLTFRAIALLPALRAAAPAAAIIECFPTATLRQLGVTTCAPVAPREARIAKTSAAARTAAQRTLARWINGIPNPEAAMLSADLLDALAAALTAAVYASGDYLAAGDVDEGQIIVPRRRADPR